MSVILKKHCIGFVANNSWESLEAAHNKNENVTWVPYGERMDEIEKVLFIPSLFHMVE